MFRLKFNFNQAAKGFLMGLSICGGLVASIPGESFLAPQDPSGTTQPVRIIGPFLSREDVGEFTRVVLKNGLTVIVFERSDTPLVAMGTYVKAGFLHGDQTQKELSSLWGPLLFRSLVPGRKGTVAGEARKLGAIIDVNTFQDHTWFSAVLSAEDYRRGLELQATAFHQFNPSATILNKTHISVRRRLQSRRDNPQSFSQDKLLDLTFYGRSRISGSKRELGESFSPHHVGGTCFQWKWLTPGNVVLVIVGNLDQRSLLKEVVKRYQGFPKKQTPSSESMCSSIKRGFKYSVLQGDIHQSWVQIGFPIPGAFTQDWYACKVLEAVLTRGQTAFLNQPLRMGKPMTHRISSRSFVFNNVGLLNLTLVLDSENIDRAEVLTFAQIERIKSGFLTDLDLQRARALLEAEYYVNQESLLDLAFQLARYEHLSNFHEWRDYLKKIRSVTRQQVISVARRYLNMDQCSLLEYQPALTEKRTFSEESFREFLKLAIPRFLQEMVADNSIKRLSPQEETAISVDELPQDGPQEISTAGLVSPLKKFSILRGPEVWVKERRRLPLASMGIFFQGGKLFEGPQNNGITDLMARTIVQAGKSVSPSDPALMFDSLGVGTEVVVESDFFGFVLHGLSKRFGSCVENLVEMLWNPRFHEEVISAQKIYLSQQAKGLLDDQIRYAGQLFLEAAYADHPYGRFPYGTPSVMEKLGRQDLVQWHRRYVKGSRPVVVIAGDVEGSSFAARFASQWKRSVRSPVKIESARKVQRLTAPQHKEGKPRRWQQWGAMAGFLGPVASDHRLPAFTVLQHLTSGEWGRFSVVLRDRLDLTEILVASHRRRALGGAFCIYLSAANQKRELALSGLKEQFAQLTTGLISQQEIDEAKRLASGAYLIDIQHCRREVLEIAERLLFGQSVYDIRNYLKKIEAVNTKAISDVSQEYFTPELWVEAIVPVAAP